MTDEEFWRNRVAQLKDGWAVRYDGRIQAARWNAKGPAEAALQLLEDGVIKPQPEER